MSANPLPVGEEVCVIGYEEQRDFVYALDPDNNKRRLPKANIMGLKTHPEYTDTDLEQFYYFIRNLTTGYVKRVYRFKDHDPDALMRFYSPDDDMLYTYAEDHALYPTSSGLQIARSVIVSEGKHGVRAYRPAVFSCSKTFGNINHGSGVNFQGRIHQHVKEA